MEASILMGTIFNIPWLTFQRFNIYIWRQFWANTGGRPYGTSIICETPGIPVGVGPRAYPKQLFQFNLIFKAIIGKMTPIMNNRGLRK